MIFRGKQFLYDSEDEAIEHCESFRGIKYRTHRKMEDKAGLVFGGLKVKSLIGFHTKSNQPYWLCECSLCDMNKYIVTASKSLVCGDVKSCGCESIRVLKETKTSHNLSESSEYRAWASMRSRCTDESQTSFASYGGLGISVADNWFQSFESFIEDMGMKPEPDYVLDRIDPMGDYSKENCRWVSLEVSSHNKGVYNTNTSGYKGVSVGWKGTWRAYLTKNGSCYRKSGFKTARAAALWYDSMVLELYGEEFGMTNLKLGLIDD